MTDPDRGVREPARRPGSIVFGLLVGGLVAWLSYDWITDTGRRDERAEQVRAVNAARGHLADKVAEPEIEIVDPLSPDRQVGKVYIYAADGGWEVSGYYRRDDRDDWHAYLATLDEQRGLSLLKVRDTDAELVQRARRDPALSVIE